MSNHGRNWPAAAAAAALVFAGASPAALALPQVLEQDEDSVFVETRLAVPRRGVSLAMRDMTGDGTLELIEVDRTGIRVRALGPDGTYGKGITPLPWRDSTVGWDLADLDKDGRTELLMVIGGKKVTRTQYHPKEGWGAQELLFESDVYLPAGVARVPFARDLDADGRLDLVLPGPGTFRLKINQGQDEKGVLLWSDEIEVQYEPQITYELGDPKRLSATFGQSLQVPWFSMFDVDGDGRQDLVSELGDRVSFYLADPVISATPTWELDKSNLKNEPDIDDIDLSDLLSVVSGLAQWEIKDLDGKGSKDLIISSEGKIQVYFGGALTGPVAEPDLVRKTSGNALHVLVRDVTGDSRPDLQVVRGERISLARLLQFLVLPGTLDFDVFTYANEDGAFAHRPTRRQTIALKIPRLLGQLKNFDEISDELEAQWDIPAKRLDWDGDGALDDVVDAQNGELLVFHGVAPAKRSRFEDLTLSNGVFGLIDEVLFRQLNDLKDGDEHVIDLGNLNAYSNW